LLGSILELEQLGVHQLKGISEPVMAFRIIGESSGESRISARQTGALTPIVGRVLKGTEGLYFNPSVPFFEPLQS
jgi:hypothetical protein